MITTGEEGALKATGKDKREGEEKEVGEDKDGRLTKVTRIATEVPITRSGLSQVYPQSLLDLHLQINNHILVGLCMLHFSHLIPTFLGLFHLPFGLCCCSVPILVLTLMK